MERLILFIFSCVVFPVSASAQTDWFPVPRTAASDIVSYESGISFLHPGSFGAGKYPFRASAPSVYTEADLDGVPVTVYSPFGPNLERVPQLFIDSLTVTGEGIHIATIDSIPEAPVTRVGFFSGERQRSNFQGTFSRKITVNSGIFIGGAADGIRGNDLIQGNAFRLYRVKYMNILKNGGFIAATIDGNRDRTDIYDLTSGAKMGNRRIDGIEYAVGIKRYPLSTRTTLSSALYYRNGAARFNRNATGTTFDDDSFGAVVRTTTIRERSIYSLILSNDTRTFAARTGVPDWNANTTRLYGSGQWRIFRARVSLGGGARYSSEYGVGASADAALTVPVVGSLSAVIRGAFAHRFPEPGNLFYPSLTWSDTLSPSALNRYWMAETEVGFETNRGGMRYGVYGFLSRANTPVFTPVPAMTVMSGSERYAGGRLTLGVAGERAVEYRGNASLDYIGSSSVRTIWPRPILLARAQGSLARYYFHRNLHAAVYGLTRLEHYAGAPILPRGTDFFLDTGVTLQVGTVTLFYTIENVTDTNQRWFDAYEVQGMNSLWGVRWNLLN